MAYFVILVVSGLVAQCYGQNSYYFENNKYCNDLSPTFGDINLDQITGIWYGVEKIQHSKGEYRIENTQDCFYLDIKEQYIQPTPPATYSRLTNSPYTSQTYYGPEQYRIRHFVVEWHEGIRHDDYHVKVNTSSKGFWPTDVPDGTVDYMYRFFGGLIQVLKVANNHLVLNFCMRLPHSQLFSVMLSRNENQLTPEDLASIHNVFTIKRLSNSSLKRVCENSAASDTLSSVLVLAVAYTIWRSRA